MNCTKKELEGIARHHCNELYPQLPSISGRAGDLDDVRFVNRENDEWIPEYLVDLRGLVGEIAEFLARKNEAALPVDDSIMDEENMLDPEDFIKFLSEVPACCNEFLAQAEFALKEGAIQDACYRAGFVSGCVEAFDAYVNDEAEYAHFRSVATAWGYLPYIGCMLEGDDPETTDEDRTLHDVTFMLGLIHGLLWFSDTDFPLSELTALFDGLPTTQ